MLDQDDMELHWNGQRTAYTCVDLVQFSVRKKIFRLARTYISDGVAYGNYINENFGVFPNRAWYDPYQQSLITAPQSGIIYRRNCRLVVIVSEALFRRSTSTLVRTSDHDRTYSIPKTVSAIQSDAFRYNRVLKAVKLNEKA